MMGSGYSAPNRGRPGDLIITPWSNPQSIGSQLRQGNQLPIASGTPIAWPAANTAIFVPFWVPEPCLATKMFWDNGNAVAGNADIGIFAEDGTRLVSAGSTVVANTSVKQIVDITDTRLARGRYYMGMVSDTAGATQKFNANTIIAPFLAACGCLQMATAYPFNTNANPAVFAKFTQAFMLEFGVQLYRTLGP